MRTVRVVVKGVATKDALEMPFVHNQEVIQALRSHGAHEPLSKGVGVRGPKGRHKDLGALGSEDFVEARHVLGVTIANQEPWGDVGIGEITGDVPRLLSDPCRVWMRCHTGDPDSPAAKLDDKQNIEAFEQHGIDVEEVRGHDTRRLGPQELAPGGSVTPGSRAEAVVFHDPGNSARGESHSELAQFTLDASVAPFRVLTCQAHEKCGCLGVDGWATR